MTDKKTLEPYSFQKEAKLLVNNEKFSDVNFLVGLEKKLIHAHKSILSLASPAFESMFFSSELKIKDSDLPVEVPDLTPIGFLNMLKYIYGYEIDFEFDELYDTYLAGDKYLIRNLNEKIFEYIMSKLDLNNCLLIFSQLIRLKNELLVLEEVKKMIRENSKTIFESENFKEIEEFVLIKILNMFWLNINEIDILKSILKWINNQVKLNGLEVKNKENTRKAFEPIKQLIRFSDLKLDELNEFTDINNLLSLEEIGSLYLYLASKKLIPFLIQCKSLRVTFDYAYFIKASNSEHIGYNNKFRILITVNQEILITKIQTTLKGALDKLELAILDGNEKLNVNITSFLVKEKWAFGFKNFSLNPNKSYEFIISFDELTNLNDKFILFDQSQFEFNKNDLYFKFNLDSSEFHPISEIRFFPWQFYVGLLRKRSLIFDEQETLKLN